MMLQNLFHFALDATRLKLYPELSTLDPHPANPETQAALVASSLVCSGSIFYTHGMHINYPSKLHGTC